MLKSIEPLFMSPLLTFEHQNSGELNSRLLAEFGQIRRQSAGLSRSNQNGWHSEPDFFKRQEPGIRELAQFILQCLGKAEGTFAANKPSGEVAVNVEGWINMNGKGGFNTPHAHRGYAWSGCYYVNQPQVTEGRSGSIEFIDPRAGIEAWPLSPGSLSSVKHRVRPPAGTLLIFPSYLVHWVYPNEQYADRVSVAFNATFPQPRPTETGVASQPAVASQPTAAPQPAAAPREIGDGL